MGSRPAAQNTNLDDLIVPNPGRGVEGRLSVRTGDPVRLDLQLVDQEGNGARMVALHRAVKHGLAETAPVLHETVQIGAEIVQDPF